MIHILVTVRVGKNIQVLGEQSNIFPPRINLSHSQISWTPKRLASLFFGSSLEDKERTLLLFACYLISMWPRVPPLFNQPQFNLISTLIFAVHSLPSLPVRTRIPRAKKKFRFLPQFLSSECSRMPSWLCFCVCIPHQRQQQTAVSLFWMQPFFGIFGYLNIWIFWKWRIWSIWSWLISGRYTDELRFLPIINS